jgi:hypothetical protein
VIAWAVRRVGPSLTYLWHCFARRGPVLSGVQPITIRLACSVRRQNQSVTCSGRGAAGRVVFGRRALGSPRPPHRHEMASEDRTWTWTWLGVVWISSRSSSRPKQREQRFGTSVVDAERACRKRWETCFIVYHTFFKLVL